MHNQRPDIRLVVTGALLLWTWLGLAAAADTAAAGANPLPVAATDASPAAETGHSPLHQRLAHDLKHEIDRVQPLLDRYGYAAVATAVGLEGAGVPTPGQTLLSAAALDAAAHPRLTISWLLLIAFGAAVLGNALGYVIGRRGGRALLARLRIDEGRLAQVDASFTRWGGWVIVFGRFIDGPRQLLSLAAGVLEMPWPRFLFFTLIGAALWVSLWGLGVYYLDEHLYGILALLHRLRPWSAAVTLVGLLVLAYLLWRLARRR